MRRWSALSLGVALALAACGGGGGKTFAEKDLPGLVLTEDDAPGGTAFLDETAGTLTLEDFWGCCKEQHDKFETYGYRTGYRAAFQDEGLPEDVADWEPGIAFARSVVALFDDAAGASKAIPVWREFFKASAKGKTKKASPGLGDEATGVAGILFKDDQEMIVYFWRVGNVIFSLQVGGRTGTLEASDAKGLAKEMHARA